MGRPARASLRWAGPVLAAALALRCHAFFGYEPQSTDGRGAPTDARADALRADAPLADSGAGDLHRPLDVRPGDLQPPDGARDLQPRDATPDHLADLAADAPPPDAAPPDAAPADGPADAAPDHPPPDLSADAAAADAGCGQAVMISEMMINPKGNDPAGEWFELYNGTAAPVSLHGWTIADKDASHTIDDPALAIPPQGYVVLMGEKAAVTPPGYVYSSGASCATEVCFANDGDRLELYDSGGDLVDQVIYTTAFPYAEAASMSLSDPCLDNAQPASWCTESVPYASSPTNAGTPGAPAACP